MMIKEKNGQNKNHLIEKPSALKASTPHKQDNIEYRAKEEEKQIRKIRKCKTKREIYHNQALD